MSQQSFDAFTREAAAAISRRRSLAALGGAGAALATGLAGPLNAGAKKNAAKKAKKKAKKKCKRQVGPCKNFVRTQCNRNGTTEEACLEQYLQCCDFFRTCNARQAMLCVTAPLNET